jgi:hypothetical protein
VEVVKVVLVVLEFHHQLLVHLLPVVVVVEVVHEPLLVLVVLVAVVLEVYLAAAQRVLLAQQTLVAVVAVLETTGKIALKLVLVVLVVRVL